MKYVMLGVDSSDESTILVPIIFPNLLVHSMVSKKIEELVKEMWPNRNVRVLSAGDISMEDIQVGGKSTTLNLDSHPFDSKFINFIDYSPAYDKEQIEGFYGKPKEEG